MKRKWQVIASRVRSFVFADGASALQDPGRTEGAGVFSCGPTGGHWAGPRELAAEGRRSTASLVVLVIDELFGLNPLAVLTAIAGMLRLVPVREYVVLADQIILQIGHAAGTGALAMIFRAWSQMLAIIACHVLDPYCFCGLWPP
jgi:hypothetical protein